MESISPFDGDDAVHQHQGFVGQAHPHPIGVHHVEAGPSTRPTLPMANAMHISRSKAGGLDG
jgi:hypothetical protein